MYIYYDKNKSFFISKHQRNLKLCILIKLLIFCYKIVLINYINLLY